MCFVYCVWQTNGSFSADFVPLKAHQLFPSNSVWHVCSAPAKYLYSLPFSMFLMCDWRQMWLNICTALSVPLFSTADRSVNLPMLNVSEWNLLPKIPVPTCSCSRCTCGPLMILLPDPVVRSHPGLFEKRNVFLHRLLLRWSKGSSSSLQPMLITFKTLGHDHCSARTAIQWPLFLVYWVRVHLKLSSIQWFRLCKNRIPNPWGNTLSQGCVCVCVCVCVSAFFVPCGNVCYE